MRKIAALIAIVALVSCSNGTSTVNLNDSISVDSLPLIDTTITADTVAMSVSNLVNTVPALNAVK